nr:sulfatase-like hydrolase/transferase [Gemmatales bacterium]
TPGLPAGTVTIATRLKQAGYVTACMGKWHLGGSPAHFGFDVVYAGKANTPPNQQEGGKGEFDLTAQAETFLEKHASRPFFLYLSHNNPHIPLAAQPERIQKFQNCFNPLYAGVIHTLDESVGRLLKKLDDLGLRDNTIVVFTSDNGGLHVLEGGVVATHNTPFRAGKGFLYEGGIRIPLLVRWPGKTSPGQENETPVVSTDWMQTLLEVAGCSAEPDSDGLSLAPLLQGEKVLKPRTLFWHLPHYTNQGSRPSGAIRSNHWKLIEHYESGYCELFDLSQDPGESQDLAAIHPERVAELRGQLEKWRRDTGAQWNKPNPQFHPVAWWRCYQELDVSSWPAKPFAREAELAMKNWRQAMQEVLQKEQDKGPGCIILSAADAKVTGNHLRYESEPHKDTLGCWSNQDDYVQWVFHSDNSGKYAIELLQAAGRGNGGALIEVAVAGQVVKHTVRETGHFQRFIPVEIGQVQLEPGPHTLVITAKSMPGKAVMDLRRVVLRPWK